MTKLLAGIAAACMLAIGISASAIAATAVLTGGIDTFDPPTYTVGQNVIDAGLWQDNGTTSLTVTPPRTGHTDTIISAPISGNPGNQAVQIYDDPNSDGSAIGWNTQLATNFWTPDTTTWPATGYPDSGVYDVSFDVMLSQSNGSFKATLTSGAGFTSGLYWLAAIGFGSSDGNSYFETADAQAAGYGLPPGKQVLFPVARFQGNPGSRFDIWKDTGLTYKPGTWYTVKFVVNADGKTYDVYFGPKGGQLFLAVIDQPWVTGAPYASNDPVSFGGMYFASSNVMGEGGAFTVDNVSVTQESGTPVPVASIAQARVLARDTNVSLSNKIVTAGSAHGVFCIEDDTRASGIRVRYDGPAIPQGDRVNVAGRVVQLSAGVPSQHAGEREIIASQVTIASTGDPLPHPLIMHSSDLGGGWLGPDEYLPSGPEPVIKGVWPYNAWGNGGVTSFNTTADSMSPLNNIGLLVSVTGRVTEPTVYDTPGTDWDFYIDDGSLVNDGWFDTALYTDEVFHPRGLRVRVTDPSVLPAVPLHYGDWVTVTGISGAIGATELGRASLHNVRVIRPRTASDIQVALKQSVHTAFDASGTALVNGKPFFPIGCYLYSFSSDVLNEVLRQGFNTVIYGVAPSDLPTLNANNLMTIPYTTSDWIAQKDNPAILAWYLADEPEGHGQTPAYMRQQYELVRAEDPSHPMGMAHFLWNALTDYKESEDFVMSDVYPLLAGGPYPLNPISDHIDEIHALHGYNYPVWPAIQAFGGPTTENGKWALPTPDQERSMVYLALAHGAKGILFFSYQPGHVDLWAEVKVLVGELKQLTPFYVLPSTNLNISSSDGQVQVRCIQVGGSGLIIADNINPAGRTAVISIPQLPVSSLALPLDGGSIAAPGGQFTATFQPYQVIVYQWGPTPSL